MTMKPLDAIPWSIVAVLGILAVLILAGHDSVVTWSLVGIVAAYLGLDAVVFSKFRGPKGDA